MVLSFMTGNSAASALIESAIRHVQVIPALLLLTGCAASHMAGNLEKVRIDQKSELTHLHSEIQTSPEKPIRWKDAHQRMVQDNLSLRQSREQMRMAKRATAEQWMSLVPRLGAFANLGESITELSKINSDSISAQLIANLNIPNPFDFYAGLYGAELQKQGAEWSHELDRRRAYVQLHTLYHEEEMIRVAEKNHENRVKNLATASPQDLPTRIATLKQESESIKRRKDHHRAQVNNILNTPGANWRLHGAPPRIPSFHRNRNLEVGEDFGMLAMQLQSIQIEVAQLRIKQSRFRQWPNFSFGLSAPPLYTTSETSRSFSADNMLFFTGANQQFNITDPIGRRPVRDARTRLQFTREQLLIRAENETLQISQARTLYDRLVDEESRLKARSNRAGGWTSTAPEVVLREIDQHTETETRRQEILRQLHQMDLQFLIWYDKFWEAY